MGTTTDTTALVEKVFDKMIDLLIAQQDELPALPTARRLLFFHRGSGSRS